MKDIRNLGRYGGLRCERLAEEQWSIIKGASPKRRTAHSVGACFLALHEEEERISVGYLKHRKGLSVPMGACYVQYAHEENLSQKQGLTLRWRH